MYRVNVLSSGDYGNCAIGARYCLTKRSCKELLKTFWAVNCDVEVQKLNRLYGDVFVWSSEHCEDWVLDAFVEFKKADE